VSDTRRRLRDENRSKEELIEELRDLRYRVADLEIRERRRRQGEDTLWTSLEIFRTLIDTLGEGVSIVDRSECFYLVNTHGEKIFGVPPGKLMGRSITEFVDTDNFTKIEEHNELRKEGKSSSYDIEITRPDGEKRIINVTASPIFDEDGEMLSTLGIFRDVTVRKHLETYLDTCHTRIRNLAKDPSPQLKAVIEELGAIIEELKQDGGEVH
jgi:PAS domain S-box-containing protein